MFLLLLLFTSLCSLCKSQSVSEYPAWPVTCSFSRHDHKNPRVKWYSSTSATSKPTQEGCEAACEGDPHCGIYQWYPRNAGCYKYQMSEKMWGDELGLNVDDLWWNWSGSMSGSKLCKATLPTNYKYTDGKYPPYTGLITGVRVPYLTAYQCKDLCSHYSECNSVVYQRQRYKHNACDLLKTTLSDGMRECGSTAYLECGTYECITR